MNEAEVIPEKKEEKKEVRTLIKAERGGALIGSSFEEQYRLCKAYFASRLMPKQLDTVEKVLVAYQLLLELKLPPMACIGKVCVINQAPSLFGELPLALVYNSGQMEGHEEWWFDKNGSRIDGLKEKEEEVFGATCTVTRKGMRSVQRTFTKNDAIKANLWGKSGPWTLYTKRMLQMRARSIALKDSFPDILFGVAILEYDFDGMMDNSGKLVGATETRNDIASELNESYLRDG